MVSCSYLHYNVIQRGREAISGKRYKITRNRLAAYMLDYFVMQMRKANRDKALTTSQSVESCRSHQRS